MSYIGNLPTQQAFVTDQFNGNGSTVAFTMSVAPANTSSVLVAVSGVLQDPSTYSVSGTTLTFSQAPFTGTGNISVRYLGIPASGVTTTAYRTVTEFTATAGQTTFTPPSYTVGFINVFQNGVRLASTDYTATNGTTVVLAIAAALNDIITTESYYVSSVLNAIPATAGAVNSTYLANSSVLQTKLGSNVVGNGPVLSAYLSTNQSVTQNVWTKIQFNVKEYDTNSAYNTTTYRFQPTVAGYYQVNASVDASASVSSSYQTLAIYKNASGERNGEATRDNGGRVLISALTYMNGSTDYIEIYAYQTGVTPAWAGAQAQTYFQATLVRSA